MKNEEFYGEHLLHMENTKDKAVVLAKFAAEFSGAKSARVISRIKTPESMTKKIQADGLPVNCESALSAESDAIGVRIIVDSISDVYAIFDNIKNIKALDDKTGCRVLNVKDFIRNPKPSGYRSLHVIIGLTSEDPDFPEMKAESEEPMTEVTGFQQSVRFFSLTTRLHLPFCLLSCFICPMHCLPAVSYSDSLSADILTLTVLLRCRL